MPDLPPSADQPPASLAAPPAAADDRALPPEPIQRRRWWRGRSSRSTPERPCLNCGDATVGMYCPSCGQRKVDVRISLRRMLREVMDDQLSLNSTLPRTLGGLFFRPGRLTREYVQGRIMRYIPPFRLYLVSSLVFFIALGFVADPREIAMSEDSQARVDSIRAARIADSVLLAHARGAGEDTTALARRVREAGGSTRGSIQFGPNPEQVPSLLKPVARRMKATEDRLNSLPRREALRALIEAFEENAPVGVFVMMPLFALILQLLYIRRKRFYVEHFVFALHVHAFVFLTGTVIMMSPWEPLDAVLIIWFLAYLFLALKHVYGQGIFRTAFKYVALGVAYSFLLIFGVTATVLAAAFSL